jgi:hypothetical protein
MKLFKNGNSVKLWSTIMMFLSVTPSQGQVMSRDQSKEFIREMFSKVFEDGSSGDSVYSKYFSTNYIQSVDGKSLNYDAFVNHLNALKSAMKSLKVTFRYLVAEDDKVATIHIVEGEKKNGTKIKAQVNAVFQIRDGKLIHCDELTHLYLGTKEDKDLGSRE